MLENKSRGRNLIRLLSLSSVSETFESVNPPIKLSIPADWSTLQTEAACRKWWWRYGETSHNSHSMEPKDAISFASFKADSPLLQYIAFNWFVFSGRKEQKEQWFSTLQQTCERSMRMLVEKLELFTWANIWLSLSLWEAAHVHWSKQDQLHLASSHLMGRFVQNATENKKTYIVRSKK